MNTVYIHLYRDKSIDLVLFNVTGGGKEDEYTLGPQDEQTLVNANLDLKKNNTIAVGATVTDEDVGKYAVAIVEFDEAGMPSFSNEKPGVRVQLVCSKVEPYIPWNADIRAVAYP